MKARISMTTLKRMPYDRIYSAFYCDLSNIMRGKEPMYYNAGVYGWNCDIYTGYVDGQAIAISTGYRNTRGTHIPRTLIAKYDMRIAELWEHHTVWDPEVPDLIESIRTDFYRDLLKL